MADSKKYNGSTWEHSLRKLGTAADTITTLPADIYADGNNATVGISGNTVQNGTPTPDNPIMPQGTGERTENLFDVSNPNIFKGYYNATTNSLLTTANNAFIYIPLVQGRKYYVYGCKRFNPSTTIRWATTSAAPYYNIPCIRTGTVAQTDIITITAETNENYLELFLCGDSDYSAYGTVEDAIATNGANLTIDNGYKIPISSANTTTPVYLGEVQSARRIKKYEFTGQENITVQRSNFRNGTALLSFTFTNLESMESRPSINGHFMQVEINPQSLDYECAGFNNQVIYSDYYYMRINLSTIGMTEENTDTEVKNAFKSYLAAQYAAGTPVCVWYVLATETTGIVNEPLMKIGDYADTVSGISIPTITGKDTFDVETALKPSEASLSYTGWHDAEVKEWDGSQWNE